MTQSPYFTLLCTVKYRRKSVTIYTSKANAFQHRPIPELHIYPVQDSCLSENLKIQWLWPYYSSNLKKVIFPYPWRIINNIWIMFLGLSPSELLSSNETDSVMLYPSSPASLILHLNCTLKKKEWGSLFNGDFSLFLENVHPQLLLQTVFYKYDIKGCQMVWKKHQSGPC